MTEVRRAAVSCIAAAITAIIAATLAATAQAAPAPWAHDAVADVHTAHSGDASTSLEVRCKGSAVEVAYYVASSELDPAIQGRPTAVFGLILDGSDQVLWLNTKLVSDGGVTSIGVGGHAADQLARLLAGTSKSIAATVLTTNPAPGVPHYNLTEFPIAGVGDAIRAAYRGCGIAF